MTDPQVNLMLGVIGLLMVESTIILTLALIVERFFQAPARKRIIWQIAFLSLAAIVLAEVSGWRPGKGAVTLRQEPGKAVMPQRPGIARPSSDQSTVPGRRPTQPVPSRTEANEPSIKISGTPIRPGMPSDPGFQLLYAKRLVLALWLIGTAALLLRTMLGHSLLILLRPWRFQPITSEDLTGQVQALARRIGMKRRISVLEGKNLKCPFAAGCCFPMIALPKNFAQTFDPQSCEVILAHETAHLAAGDPFWLLFMDVAGAPLWWNPLIWWARARFQDASEMAADEVSEFLTKKPEVLAECLLQFAEVLKERSVFAMGFFSAEGYRSGLAGRIGRLLSTRHRGSPPPNTPAFARVWVPSFLVASLLCGTSSFSTQPQQQWNLMHAKLWSLKNLAASGLMVMAAANTPAQQNHSPDNSRTARRGAVDSGAGASGVSKMDPELARRYGLLPASAPAVASSESNSKIRARLENTRFDQIAYTGLPLIEVLKNLGEMIAARDPASPRINFVLAPRSNSPGLDPLTGVPVASVSAALGDVLITIDPPLHDVRLIDVLEVMKRAADKPIDFAIEDFGVVFTPVGGEPAPALKSMEPLSVRTFHIEHEPFFQGLERTFDIKTGELQSDTKDQKSKSKILQDVLRQFMSALGVNLDPPKNIFYNDLTGVLMVRTTQDELNLVEAAVETLGGQTRAGGEPLPGGRKGVGGAGIGVGPISR